MPRDSKNISLSNGLSMRYDHWQGAGPNLIFLHPSAGYARMWEMTARHLAERFNIFAPDQRGHGDTDRPDGSYTAEEYAEDLFLFLKAQDVGKAIIVGHSLGGRVAQVFAGLYPEETLAIILVGGPHYSNFFQERDRVTKILEGVHRMLLSTSEFPSSEAALDYLRTFRPNDTEAALRHRLEHNTRPLPGGGVIMKYDAVRVAQTLAHMVDDLGRYAALARCPVAIIRIAGSSTLTIEEARRLAGFWRDARVIEVDARLLPEIENPAGLARAILDFVHASLGV